MGPRIGSMPTLVPSRKSSKYFRRGRRRERGNGGSGRVGEGIEDRKRREDQEARGEKDGQDR
jgi:hypothetical protein